MLGVVLSEKSNAQTYDENPDLLNKAQINHVIRALAELNARHDLRLNKLTMDLLDNLVEIMPEAPALYHFNRLYCRRKSDQTFRQDITIDAMEIYEACAESHPVSFRYIDIKGAVTTRRVLPIEIVHQQNGIMLLAWCELRQAQRKFFLHSMTRLKVWTGSFTERRLALIEAAIEEATMNSYS